MLLCQALTEPFSSPGATPWPLTPIILLQRRPVTGAQSNIMYILQGGEAEGGESEIIMKFPCHTPRLGRRIHIPHPGVSKPDSSSHLRNSVVPGMLLHIRDLPIRTDLSHLVKSGHLPPAEAASA